MSYPMLLALKAADLSASERLVYAYIVGRANGAHMCWPLIDEMATDLGVSRRTAMSSLKKLQETGRISVQSRYKDSNHYFVLGKDDIYGPSSGAKNGTSVLGAENSTPTSGVQKTTEYHLSGAKNDALGCNLPHSGVQKTALESKYQVREPREENQEELVLGAENSTPEPTSRSAGKKDRAPVATRSPEDWNPGDTGAVFAKKRGLDPAETFAVFRDHWRAQPGQKALKTDWPATWRNWCRRAAEWKAPPRPSLPAGGSFSMAGAP